MRSKYSLLLLRYYLLSDLKGKKEKKDEKQNETCETSVAQETAVSEDGLILHALLHPVTVKQ